MIDLTVNGNATLNLKHQTSDCLQSVLEVNGSVRAVAKGFVARRSATAKHCAIANLVGKGVALTRYGYPSPNPQSAARQGGRIFNQSERRIIFWLETFTGLLIFKIEPPTRAHLCLVNNCLARLRRQGAVHQIPNAPFGIAEARKYTVGIVVVEP